MSIRILLVDPNAIMRQGLRRLFEAEPNMEVVNLAGDRQTCLGLDR